MEEEKDPEKPKEDKLNPEELVDRTREFIVDVVKEYVRKPVKQAGRKVQSRLAQMAIGITLVCAAIVFLLIGTVQILQRELGPEKGWLAFLLVGVIALLAGGVTLLFRRGD